MAETQITIIFHQIHSTQFTDLYSQMPKSTFTIPRDSVDIVSEPRRSGRRLRSTEKSVPIHGSLQGNLPEPSEHDSYDIEESHTLQDLDPEDYDDIAHQPNDIPSQPNVCTTTIQSIIV
jgi:hypothetical protein